MSSTRPTPPAPLSGAPGAVVAISGLGFLKTSSVSFHGVPATSVTYVSATKLKATLPSGLGAGTITVTNAAASVGTVSSASNFTTN